MERKTGKGRENKDESGKWVREYNEVGYGGSRLWRMSEGGEEPHSQLWRGREQIMGEKRGKRRRDGGENGRRRYPV